MFEIHVTDTDISGGNLAVTWCLDKASLDVLAEHECREPYVVLCTATAGDRYHARKEYRKVVPLKDLIAYVEFRSAGKCNIFGFVVANKNEAVKFLAKSGAFDFTITCNGNEYRDGQYGLSIYGGFYGTECNPELFMVADPVSVEVPAQAFAPEPSEWEKTWVNLMFGDKCVDQCQFRRRRIFAYTIQPVIGLVNMAFRLMFTIVALLFGTRNFTFKYLFHPIQFEMEQVLDIFGGGTYFIGQGKNKFLNHARLIFMPVITLVIVGLVSLVYTLHAVNIILMILGFILISAALFAAIYLIHDVLDKRAERNQPWYLAQEEQALIVCNGNRKAMNLKDLPANHRTLRLRFEDLKSKVCRPFSA